MTMGSFLKVRVEKASFIEVINSMSMGMRWRIRSWTGRFPPGTEGCSPSRKIRTELGTKATSITFILYYNTCGLKYKLINNDFFISLKIMM